MLILLARRAKKAGQRGASIAINAALGAQILLGIATVISGIALPLAVLHQAVGALVVAAAAWGAHAPVAAQAIAIPFAPPTDRALTYRIEQHRPLAGKVSAFTATRDLRFERAGEGYALTVTLRAIDTDAPASGAVSYRAALGPLVGIAMRFRLDGRGKVVALDDEEAIWAKVRAGVDALATGSDGERQRA
ncbi:hypothetical protein LTR94_030428, partial [Friedmanniomyces endolithicus]